jgi:hypothetical protein
VLIPAFGSAFVFSPRRSFNVIAGALLAFVLLIKGTTVLVSVHALVVRLHDDEE